MSVLLNHFSRANMTNNVHNAQDTVLVIVLSSVLGGVVLFVVVVWVVYMMTRPKKTATTKAMYQHTYMPMQWRSQGGNLWGPTLPMMGARYE